MIRKSLKDSHVHEPRVKKRVDSFGPCSTLDYDCDTSPSPNRHLSNAHSIEQIRSLLATMDKVSAFGKNFT